MPRSETSKLDLARVGSSRSKLTVQKTGRGLTETTTARALCAVAQIEHEASVVLLGWLCVDSTAAVQSIKDRHSHASHRIGERFIPTQIPA
jgi:hypothetical protein